MLIISIGIYIFLLAFIWLVFILGKINAYKFLNISENIEKITNITFLLLGLLTILGFSIIIFLNINSNNVVDETKTSESVYY